jgi:glycosyltransferase involved in cell wall biosynthesis
MTAALVSVIVPCFNQGRFLESCLESIALSTNAPHEVIVIDDGSSDRSTLRVLEALLPASNLQTLRVLRQENSGLASARNSGLALASGEWIQFLDADDLLLPGSIDARVQAFCAHGSRSPAPARRAGVIGHYLILDDATGQVWEPEADQPNARTLNFEAVASQWERGVSIPIHCALLRREALPPAPAFNESLPSKEDWFFWMSVLAADWRFVQHDEVVALYRLHGGNMTRRSVAKNAFAWLEAANQAHECWPDRFTEDHLLDAEDHWREYYLMKLWIEIGPALPWEVFRGAYKENGPCAGARSEASALNGR